MVNPFEKNNTQNEITPEANEVNNTSNIMKLRKDLKDLIAPSGIDATDIDYLKIYSSTMHRYARCHYIAGVPRMATFPTFLRNMYDFGDINTSVFINPLYH